MDLVWSPQMTPNGDGSNNNVGGDDGDHHNTSTGADVSPSGDGRVTSLSGDGLCLEELGQGLRGLPFGLLCLSTDGLTENSPERADVVSTRDGDGTGRDGTGRVGHGTSDDCGTEPFRINHLFTLV